MKHTWLGACGAGGLGALVLHAYVARYEAERAGGAPRPVLMVTRDVEAGDVLAADDIATKDVPEHFVEERHVRAADRELLVGARSSTVLRAGSAVLWTDVDAVPEGRTLASLVRQGMRAVSLRGADMGFEGLLRPGDRVDVLFSATSDGARQTAVLLQNALVLTVGDDLGTGFGKARASAHVRQVTLSVSPPDAQLLAHARGRGQLTVALRNPADIETQDVAGVGDGPLAVSRAKPTGGHDAR